MSQEFYVIFTLFSLLTSTTQTSIRDALVQDISTTLDQLLELPRNRGDDGNVEPSTIESRDEVTNNQILNLQDLNNIIKVSDDTHDEKRKNRDVLEQRLSDVLGTSLDDDDDSACGCTGISRLDSLICNLRCRGKKRSLIDILLRDEGSQYLRCGCKNRGFTDDEIDNLRCGCTKRGLIDILRCKKRGLDDDLENLRCGCKKRGLEEDELENLRCGCKNRGLTDDDSENLRCGCKNRGLIDILRCKKRGLDNELENLRCGCKKRSLDDELESLRCKKRGLDDDELENIRCGCKKRSLDDDLENLRCGCKKRGLDDELENLRCGCNKRGLDEEFDNLRCKKRGLDDDLENLRCGCKGSGRRQNGDDDDDDSGCICTEIKHDLRSGGKKRGLIDILSNALTSNNLRCGCKKRGLADDLESLRCKKRGLDVELENLRCGCKNKGLEEEVLENLRCGCKNKGLEEEVLENLRCGCKGRSLDGDDLLDSLLRDLRCRGKRAVIEDDRLGDLRIQSEERGLIDRLINRFDDDSSHLRCGCKKKGNCKKNKRRLRNKKVGFADKTLRNALSEKIFTNKYIRQLAKRGKRVRLNDDIDAIILSVPQAQPEEDVGNNQNNSKQSKSNKRKETSILKEIIENENDLTLDEAELLKELIKSKRVIFDLDKVTAPTKTNRIKDLSYINDVLSYLREEVNEKSDQKRKLTNRQIQNIRKPILRQVMEKLQGYRAKVKDLQQSGNPKLQAQSRPEPDINEYGVPFELDLQMLSQVV